MEKFYVSADGTHTRQEWIIIWSGRNWILKMQTSQKIAGTFSPPCCLVFVGQDRQSWVPGPLHYFRIILELERERTKEEKEREEVLHLFRCYTHTPGRSQVNPERQKEEKSGHTKGKGPRTAQGGEGNRRTSGTNLHGETDLNKTAHTPKPHDTLRRSTRGELGTKWGTSWWNSETKTSN